MRSSPENTGPSGPPDASVLSLWKVWPAKEVQKDAAKADSLNQPPPWLFCELAAFALFSAS